MFIFVLDGIFLPSSELKIKYVLTIQGWPYVVRLRDHCLLWTQNGLQEWIVSLSDFSH